MEEVWGHGPSGESRAARLFGLLSSHTNRVPWPIMPYGLWIAILLPAPLAVLLLWSFWGLSPDQTIEHSYSLDNYRVVLDTHGAYFNVLKKTLFYALLASGISLTIAYGLAFYVAKVIRSPAVKSWFLILIVLPFLFGYLVRTIGWLGLLGINGVANKTLETLHIVEEPLAFLLYGPVPVVLALVYNYYPFLFFALYLTFEAMDDRVIVASGDLGASKWQTFGRVILPLSVPGVVTGFALGFIPTMGAVLEPQFLGGTSANPLMAGVIQNQFLNAYNFPLGAAMAVILILTCVAVLALLALAVRQTARFAIRYEV